MNFIARSNLTVNGVAQQAVELTITDTLAVLVNESTATGQTNKAYAVTLDISQLKYIRIWSDKDITFKTNDGSSPDETLALKANVPYIWQVGSIDTCALATDITGIFITNAAGSTANWGIEALLHGSV